MAKGQGAGRGKKEEDKEKKWALCSRTWWKTCHWSISLKHPHLPCQALFRNCIQKCLILYSSWTMLSNRNVNCVCWFFIATGTCFDLFLNVFEWFLHRGLLPVVQCKKKLSETENTRIKISLNVHGFQQYWEFPTQFKPSLDTRALQKQGMPVLV